MADFIYGTGTTQSKVGSMSVVHNTRAKLLTMTGINLGNTLLGRNDLAPKYTGAHNMPTYQFKGAASANSVFVENLKQNAIIDVVHLAANISDLLVKKVDYDEV